MQSRVGSYLNYNCFSVVRHTFLVHNVHIQGTPVTRWAGHGVMRPHRVPYLVSVTSQ